MELVGHVESLSRSKGSCKIEVRHILFKKICLFDFLKYSPNCLLHNNLLFEKKKQKTIFSFQSMPNLNFAKLIRSK